MKKCLRITFSADNLPAGFLDDFVKKHALKLTLEGVAQVMPEEGRVKVIACGEKDDVDAFLDVLHKGAHPTYLDDIEVEPFVKDKDYRGVFRVIA